MTVCCVMAKAPIAGAVKTRLCPPWTPEQAAALAAAFLCDTWAAAAAAFDRPLLSHAGELADFPQAVRGGDATAQVGGDLGARIESAVGASLELDRARGAEYPRAVIIGSDLPGLPPSYLTAAAELLDNLDVCLGPSADGGFYLIGARRWQAGLLAELPWSASNTVAATRARLTERGYAVSMTAAFDDIDEPGELDALAARLRENPTLAPSTAAALEALGHRAQ